MSDGNLVDSAVKESAYRAADESSTSKSSGCGNAAAIRAAFDYAPSRTVRPHTKREESERGLSWEEVSRDRSFDAYLERSFERQIVLREEIVWRHRQRKRQREIFSQNYRMVASFSLICLIPWYFAHYVNRHMVGSMLGMTLLTSKRYGDPHREASKLIFRDKTGLLVFN